MPLTRADKEELSQQYATGLAVAPHAFLLGYKGITVPQVTELRNRVRASGGEYLVVKNTLALRAIDSTALAALKEHFVGPTAVVWCDKDPVALAKALTDFAREVPVIQFKAGMVERRAVAPEQIKEIAQLPSREQLITKLVFLLQSPLTRLVRVLAAVPQSFVSVLDQIRMQKEQAAGPVEPPAEQKAEPPAEQKAEPPAEQKAKPPVEQKAEAPAEQKAEPPVEQKAEPPVEQKAEPPVELKAAQPVEQPAEQKAEQA